MCMSQTKHGLNTVESSGGLPQLILFLDYSTSTELAAGNNCSFDCIEHPQHISLQDCAHSKNSLTSLSLRLTPR